MNDKLPVLDHGHVILLDHMGSDQDIVAAARTSYQKGTKKVSDDETLLRYLYRNRHTSPFEMAYLKFHIKAPIFVFRQWHRHRTFSINEVSARYSELPEEMYSPELFAIRAQSKTNKQGRDEPIDENDAKNFKAMADYLGHGVFRQYRGFLENGIARELARIPLPVSTYSEMVWSGNLKNTLDFLALRMDSHAQYEIRVYAEAIGSIVERLFPLTWDAFWDYRFSAMTLSQPEIDFIKYGHCGKLSGREREELEAKMKRLGLVRTPEELKVE